MYDICVECGSEAIIETREYWTCRSCGTVQGPRIVNQIQFYKGQNGQPFFADAIAMSPDDFGTREWGRYHFTPSKRLKAILFEVAGDLQYPAPMRERVFYLARHIARQARHVQNHLKLLAACFYFVARENGLDLSLDTIRAVFQDRGHRMNRPLLIHAILQYRGISGARFMKIHQDFIPAFASKLSIDASIQDKARVILDHAPILHKSRAWVAAALYLAVHPVKNGKTYRFKRSELSQARLAEILDIPYHSIRDVVGMLKAVV